MRKSSPFKAGYTDTLDKLESEIVKLQNGVPAAHKDIVIEAYRSAAKRLHPDAGGKPAKWAALQDAKQVLDRHHGLTVEQATHL